MFTLKLTWLNTFYLLVPIFLWNLVLAKKIQQVSRISSEDKVKWLAVLENILRLPVFLLPLFMPLKFSGGTAPAGWLLYILGSFLYYFSWVVLISRPQSRWSSARLGLLAPAYTTIFWLAGIGLIAASWGYILISLVFVLVHMLNTAANLKP